MIELQTLIDIGIGVVTFATSAASMAGGVWLFFRKRIRAWWAPYRTGIEGMGRLPELEASVNHLSDEVSLLGLKIQARADASKHGLFEADQTGRNTRINLTYARMVGAAKEELEGWGYLNFIHHADREEVRREWEACRREHRVYEKQHRLVSRNGEVFVVHVTASPIPNAPPPARAWVGVVRKLSADDEKDPAEE